MADELKIAPETCNQLKRIVVRLLAISDRCGDYAIKLELMKLSDELATIIGE
jgi:hypothetical protein